MVATYMPLLPGPVTGYVACLLKWSLGLCAFPKPTRQVQWPSQVSMKWP
jgi:hypothetical protein